MIAGSEAAAETSCECRRTWRPASSAAANCSIPAIAAIVTVHHLHHVRATIHDRQAVTGDRKSTAMAPLPCARRAGTEYTNPRDRRFHAQAIACPECGPTPVARDAAGVRARGEASLRLAVRTLLEGGILAVKGLGGYHLACDATSLDAVAELRRRKGREAKPLAVMFPGTESLDVDGVTLAVLGSRERPIVLVDRSRVSATLAPNIAANSPTIGVLLPYTPIHYLLLHDVGRPLVMTSGNRSDEPMVHDEDAALEQLADIADAFLTHDRRIDARGDDSVVRVSSGRTSIVRRARGYAPAPLTGGTRAGRRSRGRRAPQEHTLPGVRRSAYVSSHIGDLESAASYRRLGRDGGAPDWFVRHRAKRCRARSASRLPVDAIRNRYPATRRVAVQHHHAHVLSCLAEHLHRAGDWCRM